MSIKTWLLDNIIPRASGRSSAKSGRWKFQTINGLALSAASATGQEPLLNLSPAGHVAIPAVVFALSAVSIDIVHSANFVSTLWLSNAVVLVALLRHSGNLTNYGSIFAGATAAIWLANFVNGNSFVLSTTFAFANFVEIATALLLLSIFKIGAANLTQFRNLLAFIVIAGCVAPLTSAAIGGVITEFTHGIPWFAVSRNWYFSDALGMILITPFLISFTSKELHALRIQERIVEAVATLVLLIAFCVCGAYFRPIIFVVVPAILFATVRFGVLGATTATLMIAFIANSFLILGIGQPLLPRPELSERILALQVLLVFTSLWSLPTAALLRERDHLLGDLSLANSQLKLDSDRKSHLVTGLRRHLSIAEEKERLRLSYELHDQAGQGLIAAILELNAIDTLIAGPAHERLHLVRKKMEELGKTLHRIAWELRPPAIDELGLKKALSSYIADWGEQCDTDVDFQCDDPNIDAVPNEIGTTVYRVVQEGLTNIVKHARQPSNVSVVIGRVNATLQVIIEDNGCGFDVGAITAKTGGYRGLGLDGMRERLLLIGGTLEIESTPGTGTALFARITLDAQRSAA
jgi:signal transduction histidine kinase